MQLLKSFILGFLFSLLSSLFFFFALRWNISFLKSWSPYSLVFELVLALAAIAIILYEVLEIKKAESSWDIIFTFFSGELGAAKFVAVLVLIGFLLKSVTGFVFVPSILIYSISGNYDTKKIIQIIVLVLSCCVALLYYNRNKTKFKTLADKVTFFSGVCLGPATAIQIII